MDKILFDLRSRRRFLILLSSDILSLFGSVFLIFLLRVSTGGFIEISLHGPLLFFLLIAPCMNYFTGLYDVPPPPLHDELRTLALSTSMGYLCVAIFLIMSRVEQPSRLVFAGAWLTSLWLVPLARWCIRQLFAKKVWWGVPTILFGEGNITEKLIAYLQSDKNIGLNPVACVCLHGNTSNSLRILHSQKDIEAFTKKDTCALVVISDKQGWLKEEVEIATRLFKSVLLVPESFGDIPFAVRPVEIGSVFCLKVRQNLLDARRLFLKRTMDIVLAFTGGLLILPFCLLIALAIRLESHGSVFFRHERIGRNGQIIKILKFRTMVSNAKEVLDKYLKDNPCLRQEWETDQKLRHDPRITRIGAFLRKTSLDELPQLWNVLYGEMSLVGPRPIVEAEIPRYGPAFSTYIRVRPGITGLWQVSGRNDVSYSTRVRIDKFYINNWSIWLDLLILAKTLPVVIKGKGAY